MRGPAPAAGRSAAAEAVTLARALGVRVAVAESLTGGLLAAEIVAVPGASHAFSGGIVAYDTHLKHSLLGVDAEQLAKTGPVDGEVARQMAAGVRTACSVPRDSAGGSNGGSGALAPSATSAAEVLSEVAAEIGIATTGVAGPDPDPQTAQPAGTVWVGVSSVLGDRAELVFSEGRTRAEIREEGVTRALELLLSELRRLRDAASSRT